MTNKTETKKTTARTGAVAKARKSARAIRAYGSGALAAVQETASDLYEAGVMDKQTLRRFDELCLTPVEPLSAAQIRAIRERERVSQANAMICFVVYRFRHCLIASDAARQGIFTEATNGVRNITTKDGVTAGITIEAVAVEPALDDFVTITAIYSIIAAACVDEIVASARQDAYSSRPPE